MPSSPPPKSRRKRISAAAAAEIAARVETALPELLAEIASVCRARAQPLTPDQLVAVATLLARCTRADELSGALSVWLKDANEAGTQAAAPVPSFGRVPSTAELRQLFAVTDAEAETLGLKRLVSERLRSRDRRRAEGARPAEEAAAARAPASKPWIGAGVSRATWYRNAVAERLAPVLESVRQASGKAAPVAKPWVAAGMSRANWYRRRQAEAVGETKGETPADPIAHEYFLYDRVALGLAQSLTPPPKPPPRSRYPTAEGRRLAVLAEQLGLRWSDDARGWEHPRTWYDRPERPLTAQEQADYAAAVTAAEWAEERRQAVEVSRARRADAAATAAPATAGQKPGDQPWVSPALDGVTCPARVSPKVWEEVPVELRPRVRRLAGRFFLHGHEPDAAVGIAVAVAIRERAAAAAIANAAPEANPEVVQELARAHWRLPTTEAVTAAVNTLDERRRRLADAEAAVAAAVDSLRPSIPDDRRTAVVEAAVRILIGSPNTRPTHAARLACELDLKQPLVADPG